MQCGIELGIIKVEPGTQRYNVSNNSVTIEKCILGNNMIMFMFLGIQAYKISIVR